MASTFKKPSPQRILIVPLRFIGDGVLSVPLIRAVKALYPQASVDILVPPHLANLFSLCPYISTVLIEPKSQWQLFQTLQKNNYDLAFLMRRSVSQALILKLAGIKTVIGYDEQRFPAPLNYQRWAWFLDASVPFPPVDTETPQVKTYLNLLSPISTQVFDETLALWTDEGDHKAVAEWFESGLLKNPLAVFHATSASREKALAPEKFVAALQALHQSGFTVAAVGTQAEYDFYAHIASLSEIPLLNLCGQTTLRETYVLLQKTKLLLSLDSGPVHLAAAANTPHIIVIYGPTNEKQWRPYPYAGQFSAVYNTSLDCRPCVPKICSHNRCRTDLTALAILQAVEKHIVECQ